MIIKKMTATFGCLENAVLELRDGLNVICAPNESGKSTWCAFLRAMFYGIPTRERDKKGFLAEKNRYQPWSGAPMEGQIDLVWQGRDITLRRYSSGSVPFGGFSAVYTGTQESVPGLTSSNCGQLLLGVGREVWERSAFVGHSPTLAIDGTAELERRIASLFSSTEEDVSYSQADARLREWQRRRQHNKNGLIPRMEAELNDIDVALSRIQAAQLRLTQAQDQRQTLDLLKQELETEDQLHRRLAQRDLNARYAQAMEEHRQELVRLDALQAQHPSFSPSPARELLLDAHGQLLRMTLLEEDLHRTQQAASLADQAVGDFPPASCIPKFSDMDPTQAVLLAHQDRATTETLQAKSRRLHALRLVFLLSFLLSAAAGGLVLLFHPHPFFALSALLLLVSSLAATVLCSYLIRNVQLQSQRLLDEYSAHTAEQITAAAEDYRRLQEQILRAQEDARRLHAELVQQQERLDRDQASLLSFVRSFAPQVNCLSDCSSALTEALAFEDRLRECRNRLDLSARRCDDLRSQGARDHDTLELLHTPQRTPEQTRQELARITAELSAADAQLSMAQGELLALGDRAALETRRTALTSQLARRRKEYEALDMALDALRHANTRLQERFAPQLNRQAGQILSALTAGRYQEVFLDREFQAGARSHDSLLPRTCLALSRGTSDQIYLAVRLAVCQLCLPQEDPCPVILDDALTAFDDKRMALAIEYLAGMNRQLLLFSCQQRECRLGLGHVLLLHS